MAHSTKEQQISDERLEVIVLKAIGVIPVRYQSSRFPGKPLADICGKPMIWWVYQQAIKVAEFEKVLISTDDNSIKAMCETLHFNVTMTSNKHLTGTDRVAEVANQVDGDIFVNIQGDETLIAPEMIEQVVSAFNNTGHIINLGENAL